MTVMAPASHHLTAVDGPPRTTRVVIAGCERLVRAGVRALLEKETGIAVVAEAATGDDAVALGRRLHPDVVLIDVQLPGLDCVAATRQMLAGHGVAVMLLTSSGADDRILAALRAGASGLLLKDTEPAELVRAVRVLASGAAVLSLLPHRSTRQGS
jgi:DNA-binding NarL/FixJ family response regulator